MAAIISAALLLILLAFTTRPSDGAPLWSATSGAGRMLLVTPITTEGAEANFDHSITQAGPVCVGRFYNITNTLYPAGSSCKEAIQQAMAAQNAGMCPANAGKAGSDVQKCMSATADAISAWVSFITDCPVLKVVSRKGGQANSVDTGFSCWPIFASPMEFQKTYLGTTPSSFFGTIDTSKDAAVVSSGGSGSGGGKDSAVQAAFVGSWAVAAAAGAVAAAALL